MRVYGESCVLIALMHVTYSPVITLTTLINVVPIALFAMDGDTTAWNIVYA